MQLFVRNRVKDFDVWYPYFMAGIERGKAYGLSLDRLWQNPDDPNEAFFLLNIKDKPSTEAFMASTESVETGDKAGVIDGEVYYLEPSPPED